MDRDSALREATMRAAATLQSDRGDTLHGQDVSDLRGALFLAISGKGRHRSIDPRLESSASRRLLELVREELLQIWSAERSISASDTLCTLQSIESVRKAIGPDTGKDFITTLKGSDGLELLVEMAHDLRSPLTSILFLAETLQRRLSGAINDLQHRQLRLIYSAALGLSEMASNVLEFVRGGNRLTEDEPSPFRVSETLESVLDIARPIAEEKGLTIRLNPPATDHRLGRPLALARVLLNLTTNGLKFTEKGFVHIVARETGVSRIEFSVRDTGPGIDPNTMETLYSPFHKAGTGSGIGFSGSGLGLALCRRLVRAMGSELMLETKPNWGTRFYFELELSPVLKA